MTLPEVSNAKPLTDKERGLLTYMEQEFLLHGSIPTSDKAVADNVASASFYTSCLERPHFVRALNVRGIHLGTVTGGILTPEQLRAANTMLDLRDNRSQKSKLKDLNVPTQRWEAWLRDPAFQSYLQRRAENLLGDNLHESHLALVDRVRSGDVNAIKYYNEITGRFIPNSRDRVDVNAVLMRVLEVIQQYVRDPVALASIAEELLGLSTLNPTLLKISAPMKIIEAITDEPLGTTSPL